MSTVTASTRRQHGLRLAIVDDHELLAQSLAAALAAAGIAATAVTPQGGAESVLAALTASRPDVVLLDLELGPSIDNALWLVPSIRELGATVVVLTGVTDRIRLAECVEAGVAGILSKCAQFAALVDDVRLVTDGHGALHVTEREALLAELTAHREQAGARLEPFQRLTVRECEVLQDLSEGRNAEVIAERAFVSVATVRSHIKSILAKLGVSSQLAAVAMARRAGWSGEYRRPER